ncbi:hypothetical protein GYMLUDRAFT_78367 [Collybiopsis luxurians FD-317 M1]|uniref:Unplaced genomic scaffold GYMLUscaffold_128, whole genome shotgun sequence n=1 Tax=Collybiopsis luxurians FD-317 M1 TaxID=944289 RepID=A0A0D0C0D9_9AGAR|nr:hypothetical protein GYMLUDRAFT_78367 [Collybiopsis luxurians FD-317 M1]
MLLASLTAAVVLAVSSALAQTCSPQLTVGAPYDIKSHIDDSYIWLFNGASDSNPSGVHLEQIPPGLEPWYFYSTSSGSWTISINQIDPPVNCVLAPSDSQGDVLKLLTTGSCSDSTDADMIISCQSCGDDGSATACTLFVPGHDECVNVPGDSNGDPSVRTLECTGSPEQLWDLVPVSDE